MEPMTICDLPTAAGAAEATRIEVGVVGRWNACAVLASLSSYRPFMIQHGPERWVVHAQAPGCHGENAASAVAAIETCLEERGITAPSIRIDRKQYLPVARAARLV